MILLGDWVRIPPYQTVGFVKRMAKDGSWADVDWGAWTKRQKTSILVPQHTIPFGKGTVTDVQREAELEERT